MALPKQRPPGLDSPWTTRLLKYGSRANTRLFRLTNGRVGGTWRIGAGWSKPVPVLLLDHVGRKSGAGFSVPLLFLRDGERFVVVGSQGGLPQHPQWFHNLRATPDTTIHVPRGGRVAVRARVASAAERAELWPRLVDLYADFATYQTWTDREIPVVILDPR